MPKAQGFERDGLRRLEEMNDRSTNITAANAETLYRQYRPLMLKIARKYQNFAELADLTQMAALGLIDAITRYDADKANGGNGVNDNATDSGKAKAANFSTWLYLMVTRRITLELSRQGGSFAKFHTRKRIRAYYAALERLRERTGNMPTNADIAAAMNLTEQQVNDIQNHLNISAAISIDAPMGDGGANGTATGEGDTRTALNLLPDHNADKMFEDVENGLFYKELWQAANKALNDYEWGVLYAHFAENKPYTQMCDDYGVTAERMQRIGGNIITKLRRNADIRRLCYKYGYTSGYNVFKV